MRHRRSVRVLKLKAAVLDSRTLRKVWRAWLAARMRRRRNRTRWFGFAAKRQRNLTMRILKEWRRVVGAALVAARKGAVPSHRHWATADAPTAVARLALSDRG
jgi:hypothetical protein